MGEKMQNGRLTDSTVYFAHSPVRLFKDRKNGREKKCRMGEWETNAEWENGREKKCRMGEWETNAEWENGRENAEWETHRFGCLLHPLPGSAV
jgi:hypothetical protein